MVALAACQQTTQENPAAEPTPEVQRTTTPALPDIPAPRVTEEPASPAAPAAEAPVRGMSAEATRAAALAVTPAAPGWRVSRVHVPGMYVALTFDDGPAAATTPQVLDILKRNNAVGTFFVLGENAARNRSLVARAAAEGNEIGVHTWSHIKMTGSSLEKVDSEISRTGSLITEITGRAPLVMRPPYGAVNGGLVNHMKTQYGLRSILWDVDTLDWKHPGVQKVINTAVGQAKPGSIILVHDIHASTVAAIEGIVQGLQARGFKLVTVSQLISLANRAAGQSDEPAAAPAPAEQPAEGETPDLRAATESGAAAISATTDAAAEEIAPAAEPAPAAPAAPAVPEGAAGISGQDDLL